MLYFPTALIVDQLPAGLASVGQVPALQAMPAKTHAAKVHNVEAVCPLFIGRARHHSSDVALQPDLSWWS